LSWYLPSSFSLVFCIISTLIRFLRLSLSISKFGIAHLLPDSLSLTFATTRVCSLSQLATLKRSGINYTWMQSFKYQDIINLNVCILIRRSLSAFMNTVIWEHCTLVKQSFDVAKFTHHYWLHVNSHTQLSIWNISLTSQWNVITKFSCGIYVIDLIHTLVPYRSCYLYQDFIIHLWHEHLWPLSSI
jgi:hypothetical protein